MEKLFAATLVVLALCFMVKVEANGCTLCPVRHPQQKFCEADFVFVGTVRGAQEGEGFMVYDLKVSHEKVFKGEEYVDRTNQYTKVFTPYGRGLCGRPNLVYTVKYLISGTIVDGRLQMTYCDWVTEWENISPKQLKYLKRGTYAEQCGGCEIKGVYSEHSVDMNDEVDTFHESQLSGKWSRHLCTYNPVASYAFMDHDCENKHSYCTFDVATNSCMWKSSEEYNQCFNTREATWALQHPKQAAFTRPGQCRGLPTRRLKKKCLRAVIRHRQTTGGGSIIREIPIDI